MCIYMYCSISINRQPQPIPGPHLITDPTIFPDPTMFPGPTLFLGPTLFPASRSHRINMDLEIIGFTMILMTTTVIGCYQ